MIAGIRQRLTRFLERIENGDLRLITDDRWLPNPIDDIIGKPTALSHPGTGLVTKMAHRRRVIARAGDRGMTETVASAPHA